MLTDDEPLELARSEISTTFPEIVSTEVQSLNLTSILEDPRRVDLTSYPVTTIDDEGSIDKDDGLSLSVELSSKDGKTPVAYRLGIHIADAGAIVPPNSAIDHEAQIRMATLYLPERNIPMLPLEIGNDMGSLLPGVKRATLSLILECDENGEVVLWGQNYSVENTFNLNLSNSGLTGAIPPGIGCLSNLQKLELQNNQLTGSIPSEIGNLTNLTYLDLLSNQLTGSIPSEIGNLTNLTYLRLDYNQLTGSIPPEIGNLTNLEYVSLTDNQLTGSIPPEIGNMTNLEWLDLTNNQLTGSIPSKIGNLTNLTGLNLAYNQLTGEIPESICDLNINWSNSGFFSISNNQFCPPYPSCIEDYVGEQDTSDCD